MVTRLAAFWWRTDINFPNPEFFFPTGHIIIYVQYLSYYLTPKAFLE